MFGPTSNLRYALGRAILIDRLFRGTGKDAPALACFACPFGARMLPFLYASRRRTGVAMDSASGDHSREEIDGLPEREISRRDPLVRAGGAGAAHSTAFQHRLKGLNAFSFEFGRWMHQFS